MTDQNYNQNYNQNCTMDSAKLNCFKPALPSWKVHFTDNTYFSTYSAPNAFNRWMQRICFGLRWEKVPK